MSTLPMRTGSNPVRVTGRSAKQLLRLRRMAREVRVTDQVLSPDLDTVEVVEDHTSCPAWTAPDGETITINASVMPSPDSRRDVAVWLGTNAHELFHNLFTPRSQSPLMLRIAAAERSTMPGIHHTWNVVEDQRIERLGLAAYPGWRGYLISALSYHIPKSATSSPEAWLLIAGRTWLSAEVRTLARGSFVAHYGPGVEHRAVSLIGAYQRLADTGDTDSVEAFDIVRELWETFGSNGPDGPCCHESVRSGEPDVPETDPRGWPTADEPDDDDDADADGDDAGGQSGGEGEGEGGGESDTDDAGGEGEAGDGSPGHGTSAPDGTVHDVDAPDLRDLLDQASDDALGDDDASSDLDRVIDQLDHGSPGAADIRRTQGVWIEATTEARLLARDVTAVLSDIRDECEAGWIRRTDSGRFNVGRWATDPEWDCDTVFDLFDPGAMDASALDVSLVLDISGSMSSEAYRLAEATWAIRTAVDRVEGECSVLAFGDDASLMFDVGQRPDGRMLLPRLEGSTNPTPAIHEALWRVARSTATNRLVVILTDGEWWGQREAEQAVTAIKAEGATVAIVGLGRYATYVTPGFCGADVVGLIKSSSELVPLFRELAEKLLRTAIANAR